MNRKIKIWKNPKGKGKKVFNMQNKFTRNVGFILIDNWDNLKF